MFSLKTSKLVKYVMQQINNKQLFAYLLITVYFNCLEFLHFAKAVTHTPVDGTSMNEECEAVSLRCEVFNVRRRRTPSSHVSNETYSEPNGTEDLRRLVSTAVAWRVSRKCLKRLAGSVSPGFGSEFSFS